jgi:hypothetical protein
MGLNIFNSIEDCDDCDRMFTSAVLAECGFEAVVLLGIGQAFRVLAAAFFRWFQVKVYSGFEDGFSEGCSSCYRA